MGANFFEALGTAIPQAGSCCLTMDTAMKRKADKVSRVAKGQELEVEHLVEVTDVDPKQARTLLRRHGADWPKLKEQAEALKKED